MGQEEAVVHTEEPIEVVLSVINEMNDEEPKPQSDGEESKKIFQESQEEDKEEEEGDGGEGDEEEGEEEEEDEGNKDVQISPKEMDEESSTLPSKKPPTYFDFLSQCSSECDWDSVSRSGVFRDALHEAGESVLKACEPVLPETSKEFDLTTVLEKGHVVSALQEFCQEPVIHRIIVSAAKSGEFSLKSIEEATLENMGDVFEALSSLVRSAPELVQLIANFLFQSRNTYDKNGNEKEGEAAPFEQEDACHSHLDPIHNHVLCDGCVSKERIQASLAGGFRYNNYICGVRWKSAIIHDFDLCSSCEASGDFEESHGPFLKIVHPRKNPATLLVVQRDAQVKPRVKPTPADVPPSVNKFGVELVCPAKHALGKFRASRSGYYTCDSCNQPARCTATLFGCRKCDFDLCLSCANAQSSDGAGAGATGARAQPNRPAQAAGLRCKVWPQARPRPHVEPEQAQPPLVKPQAKFVRDITVPDGLTVAPNKDLFKVWRICNRGITAWPAGIRLKYVGGELMGGPKEGVAVPALGPNQEFDVGVHLTTPSTPGRYVGYWRLCYKGQRFGHRLWVDVSVRDQPESSEKYINEIAHLVELGFTNICQNVANLERFKGDVEKVANHFMDTYAAAESSTQLLEEN